jgi:hypothetical protein
MRTRLITLRLRCPQPFWLCTPEEIQGGAAEAYVFKSFGDMHTTVPVYPHQSERTGRFVRLEVRTHARTHARRGRLSPTAAGGWAALGSLAWLALAGCPMACADT